MNKFFALTLMAALLSVSSIPLLPAAPSCTHAIEDIEEQAACHDESVVLNAFEHGEMPDDMDMSDMHLDDDSMPVSDVEVSHDQQLSEMAKECRIECGCGCNRSLDGFPQVLMPHVMSHFFIDESIMILLASMLPMPSLVAFVEPVSTPPPRLI